MEDSLDNVWRALADPTRRRILDLIRGQARTTGDLAAAFPELSRYAIMKHLGVLEAAGLVLARREGRKRYNHLNAVPLRRVYERWVSRYEDLWAGALVRLQRSVEGTAMAVTEQQTQARVIRIEEEVRITAGRETVFNALTHGIGEWFWRGEKQTLPKVVMEQEVGGRFWRPGPGGSGELYATVGLLEPPAKLRLHGAIGGAYAVASVIMITLTEEGPETVVQVSHRLAGEITEEELASYNEGWKDELQSMKRFVETGKGRA
ncbi:MAG: metalloregulator ArsR/SmtB family transcription factor [Phycisphaerales bacterium JB039]